MSIQFRWLGYVSLEMVLPSGKVLVVDPFIDFSPTAPIKNRDVTGADYIAVTHGHYDHITDIGPLAKKYDSKVICSHQLAKPLINLFELDPDNLIRITAGETLELEGLTIDVKKAEHIDLVPVMRVIHKRMTGRIADRSMSLDELREAIAKVASGLETDTPLNAMRKRMQSAGIVSGEQLNFLLHTGDNLRTYIYNAGPDEILSGEVARAHPNILFVQLGGVRAKAAAEVAARSGAEIVIPTHHDGEGVDVMHKRARKMAGHLARRSKARLLDIDHGKWYRVGVDVHPEKS